MNVRQDTTLSNSDVAKQLVQLLVVADSELEVARNDTGLLVVTGGVASQFQNFSGEVLQDSSEVNRGTCVKSAKIPARALKGRIPAPTRWA